MSPGILPDVPQGDPGRGEARGMTQCTGDALKVERQTDRHYGQSRGVRYRFESGHHTQRPAHAVYLNMPNPCRMTTHTVLVFSPPLLGTSQMRRLRKIAAHFSLPIPVRRIPFIRDISHIEPVKCQKTRVLTEARRTMFSLCKIFQRGKR